MHRIYFATDLVLITYSLKDSSGVIISMPLAHIQAVPTHVKNGNDALDSIYIFRHGAEAPRILVAVWVTYFRLLIGFD